MVCPQPKWTTCVLLLLSLSNSALDLDNPLTQQRRIEDGSIHPEAFRTSCTAITGWYDTCVIPTSGGSFCDADSVHILNDPLFINLNTCYSNPFFDGRSVSFFGEAPDEARILEFHLIFKSNETDQNPLKGINCTEDGSCECSSELKSLKEEFLKAGKCDNNEYYTCLYEDFQGVDEECFVPASLEFVVNNELGIWCSMAAVVQMFRPCNTSLDIPLFAYDVVTDTLTDQSTGPTAMPALTSIPSLDPTESQPTAVPSTMLMQTDIHSLSQTSERQPSSEDNSDEGEESNLIISGWWTGCTESRDAPSDPCSGAHLALPEGGAIIIDFESCYSNPNFESRGVSFYWLNDDNDEIFGYHLLLASDDAYSTYAPTNCNAGSCDCSMPSYLTDLRQKLLDAGSCSVIVNEGIKCLKQQVMSKSETCYVPILENFSTDSEKRVYCAMVADLDFLLMEDDDGDSSMALTIKPSAAPADDASVPEVPNLVINGWWTDCMEPTNSDSNICRGGNLVEPDNGTIIIDFESCYTNPNFDPRAISFYKMARSSGAIVGFHILLVSDEAYSTYAPTDCNAGVCYCSLPTTLGDLRIEILKTGRCGDSIVDGVNCVTETISNGHQSCYVPIHENVGASNQSKHYCAMVADVDFLVDGDDQSGENVTDSSSSQPSDITGLPIWAITVIPLIVMFVVILLALGVFHYRRRGGFYDADVEDEEVWISPRSHDYKFTRRALNTEEEGEGVWKRSNIHDLRFQMTL